MGRVLRIVFHAEGTPPLAKISTFGGNRMLILVVFRNYVKRQMEPRGLGARAQAIFDADPDPDPTLSFTHVRKYYFFLSIIYSNACLDFFFLVSIMRIMILSSHGSGSGSEIHASD